MRIALVTTLIRAGAVLGSWVAHHRALGVERFYLFVDDPAELGSYQALQLGDVYFVVRDADLAARWQQLDSWSFHQPYCERQAYSRQCLNVDLAMQLARADGLDWLLHLDIDELLHVPATGPRLADYFAAHGHTDMVSFANHEAVPEHWHIDDYFAEVTLFKRSFHCMDEVQRRIALSLFGARYFLAYSNGKAAVNLHGSARQSAGAHEFTPVTVRHDERALCVLHFAYCGFNWFYSKFAVLGDFDNQLLGLADIGKMFPLLDEGRAAVVRGSIHDATRIYRGQVMRQAGLPHSLAALLEAGILLRIGEAPIDIL